MKKYGLIGHPLEHSFSCDYFNKKFKDEGIDAVYVNYDLDSLDALPDLIESEKDLVGLNVTSPFKVDVLNYVDVFSMAVGEINAANVLKIHRIDGQTVIDAYNTDTTAFSKSIVPLMKAQHTSALILGTGGAAHAVFHALTNLGIECVLVSRTHSPIAITYSELTPNIVRRFKIVVNCTPAGMYPKVNSMPPFKYEYLTSDHLLYDLIYNPEETKFLKKGRMMGAATKNGLEMLHLQAEESWRIWNKCDFEL